MARLRKCLSRVMLPVSLILCCTIVTGGCTASRFSAPETPLDTAIGSDIGRSFEFARVFLPHREGVMETSIAESRKSAKKFALLKALPTVIYLHGCTGLRNAAVLRQLAAAGFAVIAPDSFARRYRPMQCRPRERRGGENLFVFDFRMSELAYAVHKLPELSWVDMTRLFLIGNSEGAVAAAHYRGDVFRARILAQWTCHGGHLVAGISAPPSEPILTFVQFNDPWYDSRRTRGQAGDCGRFLSGRPESQSVILSDEGRHDIFGNPTTMGKIVRFLRRHGG